MNKVRCDNGHFYDADRFHSCPICGSEAANQIITPQKKSNHPISRTTPLLEQPPVTEDAVRQEVVEKGKDVDELLPTEIKMSESDVTVSQENEKRPDVTDQGIVAEKTPLREAVEATSSTTISALPKTTAYYDFEETIPPVGWMVCVKGPHIGTAFECRAGKNRIGRDQNAEISLMMDNSVSRGTQAILIYDPREKRFYIQAGESDGLVYLNDKLMFGHEELRIYDKIAISSSEFVFIPLCGEHFTWEEYITES